MKRYFDLYKQHLCAVLDIKKGSPAESAPAEEFEKFFKTSVHEVHYPEFLRLKKEYTDPKFQKGREAIEHEKPS